MHKQSQLEMNSLHKVQREDEKRFINPRLRNQLNDSMEKTRFMKMEIEQLKKEILRQKNQIASLQAQVVNKKYILPNKLRNSASSDTTTTTSQKISGVATNNINGEESLAVEKLLYAPDAVDRSTCRPIFSEWPRRVQEPTPTKYSALTPKLRGTEAKLAPPPPPPPPPPRSQTRGVVANSVRRVPEVVELYRSLTKMGGRHNTKSIITGIPTPAMTSRDMIGEIEKRSAYLLAVKSEVVSQAEFINFLSREVENASYKEMSEVEAFVKWLDEELSYLVDERAVLKHFPQWPELKADVMREAAFNYRDLKNLETEISSFHDEDTRQSTYTSPKLKLIKALQDKLESSVHNLEKVRESAIKKYRDFKIPWQWMLDTGIITQLKLGSLKLVKVYMRRSVAALQSDVSSEEQDLLLQSVRFAFQVHQFVGGFDEGSRQAFQELQKLARISFLMYKNQNNALSETST